TATTEIYTLSLHDALPIYFLGALPDKVVHDRQVMWSKIPNHIYVMLEQAQVDAHGVVVIQVAQHSFLQQLFDLAHGSGEEKGVVHHDLQIFPDCKVDQFFRLRRGTCERLLDENVLAILQGGFGKFEVRPDGGYYRDCVNFSR